MSTPLPSELLSYKMWVLVPHLETDDPNLKYYYDFSQSYQEYTRVFTELKMDWAWQPVSMDSITETIHTIKNQASNLKPLVINLCDGDEVNGCPGVSVIDELEKNEIPYTGSNRYFYEITTSKIPMKKAFDEAGVPTAKWGIIDGSTESCVELCNKIEPPLIIKPAISGGSMGVAVKNVVKSREQLLHRVEELNQGYRGWQLTTGGLFAEKFIEGPEFTTLIVGDASDPHNCFVFEPVERVFHESLPETEKFLSFDRLWEIYEDETPMPNNENFYSYRAVSNDQLREELKRISLQAYCAVSGKGYGRLDIRMDRNTGLLYLLEVNAQCGLSEDEDYTSIGAILRVSGRSFTELVAAIIGEGIGKRIM